MPQGKPKDESLAARKRFYQVQMYAIGEMKRSGAYTDQELGERMREVWQTAFGDLDEKEQAAQRLPSSRLIDTIK
jgi:hypothetical protein